MIRLAPRFEHRLVLATGFVSLGLASFSVFAQQSPALDHFDLSLGGYYANTSTNVGASTTNDEFRGNINLENDLGFRSTQTVPRAQLDFLIGDSQGFSFDYFSLNRSHSRTLADGISYDGDNYDAMASVNGKLDFDFGSASYRWWFGRGNNVFGVGLGGAWYRVHADISGEASLNGQSIGEASTSSGAQAWAPELQLGWRYAFNDQWRIYADASGVKKRGGDLYGHIYNVDLGIAWYPWKNLGFGAEYDYTRIKLNQQHTYYDDDLDMKLNGPSLFVKLRF